MTTTAAPLAPLAPPPARGGRRPSSPARRRRRAVDVLLGAIAIVVFVCSVFPVYWMVNTSLMPNNETRTLVPNFVPSTFTWRNYETVLSGAGRADFLPALANSATVTLLTVGVCLIFAFLAALAVTRFRFRGRRAFVLTILVVQMIPGEAMIISTYRVLDGWQLLNTIAGLTLVYVATVLPFTIWTLRGFVNGVPIELEEAGMVDGLSRTGAFFRITFPLLAPGLVAAGVFGFLQAWNEYTLALVVMTDPDRRTLPLWLQGLVEANRATDWGVVMAGATLIAVPVIAFFLFVQKRLSAGLVAGAVKG